MTRALPRLKRRREFLRAAAGRKAAAPGLVLQAVGQGEAAGPARVGFTASKRVGGAVTRNRVRRRLKAVAAEIISVHAAPGFDYVLIGRAGTADRPYDALRRDLVAALKRLKLYREADRPQDGSRQEGS